MTYSSLCLKFNSEEVNHRIGVCTYGIPTCALRHSRGGFRGLLLKGVATNWHHLSQWRTTSVRPTVNFRVYWDRCADDRSTELSDNHCMSSEILRLLEVSKCSPRCEKVPSRRLDPLSPLGQATSVSRRMFSFNRTRSEDRRAESPKPTESELKQVPAGN